MSETELPVRCVFDCNVLLQAMAHPEGPAGACLDCVRQGSILLFVSRPILAELLDVAARPVLVRKLALTSERTAAFVDELLSLSSLLESITPVFAHPLDPKDSMYVDLAIACNAQVITTRDKHLLRLRDPKNPIGIDFMSRFPEIDVLTPTQLLQRVRAS